MSKSVSDWLKSFRQKSPSRTIEKTEEEAVLQSILSEVEMQIKANEEFQRQQQLALRRRGSQVDYTWLLSSSCQKTYQIPSMEKIQLAELGTKVKPSECNALICQFRALITEDSEVSELPRLMCNLITDLLSRRGEEETTGANKGPKSILRALNLVKIPSKYPATLTKGQYARRNSSMHPGTGEGVFLVERAFSFPMLRMDKMDSRSSRYPEAPPL